MSQAAGQPGGPPGGPASTWFLDEAQLLAELKRARPAAPPPDLPGYSGLVELSRGGQGVVFAGVQVSTGRRVAVKVIHGGALAGNTERLRFRREIALAASLRHPGIVRVYDSGETDSGGLFLVMEFVEGVPIDEAAKPRGLRERLALLADVSHAVQYAHRRGVIHRDLKPSNIRVDAEGVPRILDFGLAKPAGASPAVTDLGHFVGSLPWASPEQVSGDPSAIDSRSDVYALGVILYQLVTGQLPYDTSGAGREGGGLHAAVAAITSAEPPALRTRVADAGEDLQAIVSTALAKRPDDRYQNAVDLEHDLRSLLAGQPIRARRDSLWRSMQRRARRYRLAALAIAAVLVVVVGLLLTSLRLLGEAQRSRLLAERRQSQQAAVNAFLVRALSAADPSNLGRDAKVIDLLAQSARGIDAEFAAEPATAASLHGTLATTYRSLGALDDARREVDRQDEIARALDGPDGPETLAAELNKAVVLRSAGHSDQAEPLARRVLDLRTRALGPSAPATLEAMNIVGNLVADLDRLEESETILRRCVQLRRDTLETSAEISSPETVESMLTLAVVLRARGKPAEAVALLADAVPAARRLFGPDHPNTLIAENNRANLLMNDLEKPADAEPIFRAVDQIQTRKLGPTHQFTLGTRSNLATSLQRQGGDAKIKEAEELFRSCAEGSEAAAGPAAPRTLIFKNNLANLLMDLKKHDQARPFLQSAYDAATTAIGPGHSITLVLERNLGRCLGTLGQFEDGERLLLDTRDKLAKGADPAEAAELDPLLVELYTAWGRPDQAARWKPGHP